MNQHIILGIGSGRCGTLSLAHMLNRQPGVQVSHEERPRLPWKRLPGERVIRERFARMRRHGNGRILGDVALFYLPYVEDAIVIEPSIRIVCLKRPREEVVQSFCSWLDRVHPLPTNHWAVRPASGWYHEPIWTRIFPQYDTLDQEEGIRRYWDEYYARVDELVRLYPHHIRLYETGQALNTEVGLRDLLTFVGIPAGEQVMALGVNVHETQESTGSMAKKRCRESSHDPLDPHRCVVLVSFAGIVAPHCERALKELERRGYEVQVRRGGRRWDVANDQGRNRMATKALIDGFEETMWIDGDIEFHPDDVDSLRAHGLPITCGINTRKGKRSIVRNILLGTPLNTPGGQGGLVELSSSEMDFFHVRREVYQAIQLQLELPVCNERSRSPVVPFFQPVLSPYEDGHRYLDENYAFCDRARQCGFRIMADPTVRLRHLH